jgi:hypothetical protein
MNIDAILFTGLISAFTQYFAVVLTAVCIVDYFSYKSRRILLITLPYLFVTPAIFTIASSLLFHPYSNGMLLHSSLLSYYNLTMASTIHLLLGFMVLVMYSRDILLTAKSRIVHVWRRRTEDRLPFSYEPVDIEGVDGYRR